MTKPAIRVLIPVLIVAAAIGGTALVCHSTDGKSADIPKSAPVAISTAAAKLQDIPIQIQAVGTVVPYETVTIKSRIDSQITEVKFKDGDEVKKGDPLFILDNRTLKAQLDQAQAVLTRDKAQLTNTEQLYHRNEDLFQKKAVSEQIFQDSKAAFNAQTATVAADEANVENLTAQLDYTIITAPIDGRTGTINVTTGNNVKANDATLVTINQIKPVLVQASVPQNNFDAIRESLAAGQVPVSVTRDTDKKLSEGTLEYIDNAIDQGTGTFVTRAAFPNEDEALWPGMLVTMTITVGQDKQALVIPEVAVQSSASGDFVFVISGTTAQKRPVKVIRTQNGLAMIAEGLKDKEQVAVDGMMTLTDGSIVNVSQGKSAPAGKPAL